MMDILVDNCFFSEIRDNELTEVNGGSLTGAAGLATAVMATVATAGGYGMLGTAVAAAVSAPVVGPALVVAGVLGVGAIVATELGH